MRNLLLAVIAVFAFVGCQKQNQAPENIKDPNKTTDKFSVKIQDGRVIFPSEKAYNNYFHSDSKKALKSEIANSDFVSFVAARKKLAQKASLRNTAKECEIPEELIENNKRFFQLLNENGIFEVGIYVFRYSYCDDGVWVITKENFMNNKYREKFMSGELTDDIVGFFPSNVDAFAVLAMGNISMPEKGSADYQRLMSNNDVTVMKAHARHYYEHFFVIPDGDDEEVRMRGKLSYDKFAVYFNFYGKEKYQTHSSIGWTTTSSGVRTWKVDYYYRCRRKGKSYDYTGSATVQPPLPGENKLKVTFYDGSRGLENGEATWKVYNILSTEKIVQRDYGAGFVSITSDSYPNPILTNDVVFSPLFDPLFGIVL